MCLHNVIRKKFKFDNAKKEVYNCRRMIFQRREVIFGTAMGFLLLQLVVYVIKRIG